MKNISNDDKIKISRIRKVLRVGTIIFSLLTVIFALLSLIIKISPFFSVICLIIEIVLTKYSEKIDYRKK